MGSKATHHIPDDPAGTLVEIGTDLAAAADPVAQATPAVPAARRPGDQGLADGAAPVIPADAVGAVAAGTATKRPRRTRTDRGIAQ